jgi:ceramide glucosyltransferase
MAASSTAWVAEGVGLIVLGAWSLISITWWILAVLLVQGARCDSGEAPPEPDAPQSPLTLFKPLPRVESPEMVAGLAAAIESFVVQMDSSCEMLLGIPEDQAGLWLPEVARWRERCPAVGIREMIRPTPRHHANPKIAWLAILAPEARGTEWLWSDADIVAPPGLLTRIRTQLRSDGGIRAVTVPYCVRKVPHAVGWLDALFVNMEFLPGTLLLRRMGPVSLGFGAAVLFRSEDFRRMVSWEELGASLADDHELGRQLAPVRIADVVAETSALESRLVPALRHLHRWQKTIRWCRPAGFAALVVLFPLLGFVAALAVAPGSRLLWSGLAGQYLLEAAVVLLLLNRVRFSGPLGGSLFALLWPALRCVVWLAAWLPLPVVWQDPGDSWLDRQRRPKAPST